MKFSSVACHWRWLAVAAFLVSGMVNVGAQPVSLQDDQGRTIRLPQAPQRIVSLLPSLTEMVCELDRCDRLVGVDRYSKWPSSLERLPKLGGGLDPNIEAIVALRPDVVLMSSASKAAQRLESLGISVVQLNTQSYDDVHRDLLRLGQLLHVEDAEKHWLRIDDGIAQVAQKMPASAHQLKVYFEVNPGPYGAGQASFIGEIMTRLGVQNIIPPPMGPFPKLNPEFVVRSNPDVILMGEAGLDDMLARPGWQQINAVRTHRVCTFSPQESDILVRPGPRMAQAAQIMSRCFVLGGVEKANDKAGKNEQKVGVHE